MGGGKEGCGGGRGGRVDCEANSKPTGEKFDTYWNSEVSELLTASGVSVKCRHDTWNTHTLLLHFSLLTLTPTLPSHSHPLSPHTHTHYPLMLTHSPLTLTLPSPTPTLPSHSFLSLHSLFHCHTPHPLGQLQGA